MAGYFPFGHWISALQILLLRSLLAPAKPKEKKYDKIVAKLAYQALQSDIVQCFCLNSRWRKPGGSVAGYMVELRRLAQY